MELIFIKLKMKQEILLYFTKADQRQIEPGYKQIYKQELYQIIQPDPEQ